MSWKVEVKVGTDKTWYSNQLRFKTRDEAVLYSLDIYERWTLVVETRVAESQDPVNYRFVDGKLQGV